MRASPQGCWSCDIPYDLALEVMHGHFYNILLLSQASSCHWEGTPRLQTLHAGVTGATLEAGCHDSAGIRPLGQGRGWGGLGCI